MGIIVLIVALLSQLGVGANQVFQAEAPGAVSEKLTPRVAKTARILWITYLVMTILETLLLWLAGMSFFDALCHSFTSTATGGFSTKNLSVGHFSPVIQWIVLLFIFLAGANFALYFQTIRGRSLKFFLKDPEFKLYCLVIFAATCFIAWEIQGLYPLGEALLRNALFQAVSVLTTTGFAITDYGGWNPTAQLILLLLMFIGGCSGSTAGGIKIGRLRIILSQTVNELKRLIHPRGVFSMQYGNRSLTDEMVVNVLQYFFLHMLIFAGASLLIVHLGADYLTAFSGVASTLGNVGPGLGPIGPAGNFAAVSDSSKWIFSFLMLLGRLEIYTVLVLISPAFWRK
jgi:trk system potassium uptake protein TrkH